MLSTIFQPEVSALESQVVALQAQIAAHTERIALLSEAESVTGGTLEALKGAIQKVSSLAPSAIANLKSAVLNLFSGGDNSNEGGNGNQPTPPTPAPQPGFDNRTLHELALDACREYAIEQEAIAPQPELTGQSCEWASPLTSPLASLLSSWLCCQLEDAPSAALTGQSVDLACVISDAPQQEPYVELIPVTHLVAYQRRRVDGEIICCYLAGNNKNRLKDWGSWLCNQHSVGSGFELRLALRMTAYKWELKIWGMSIKQIQRLAQEDTTKTPPSRYHVASQIVAERLLAPEEVEPEVEAVLTSVSETISLTIPSNDVEECLAVEAELKQEEQLLPLMFHVGDRIEIVSDRHGVELVGQTGTITAGTASGAAVDVGGTLRWFCSDELAPAITPESPALQEPTEVEKIAIASIQPLLPAPAYNPNPIGRGGAMANWKARQASGIGVDLKNCGTGGITTLEEWRQIEAEQKALAATASTADEEPDF